jgi:ligand-binding SRPBCC domain-containing protein
VRFVVRTNVATPPDVVFPVFGEKAFVESLSPRIMGLHVVRIGLALDDEIEVRFAGLGPRGPWVSRIDTLERSAGSIFFVDESTEIPWPFRWVHHHHGLIASGGGTTLIDDVRFETRLRLLGALVYPVLWWSFVRRRRAYEARFGKA